MKRARSQAMKSTASPISYGVARRPRGTWARKARWYSAVTVAREIPAMSVRPGDTTLTVMPWRPSSRARTRASWVGPAGHPGIVASRGPDQDDPPPVPLGDQAPADRPGEEEGPAELDVDLQ